MSVSMPRVRLTTVRGEQWWANPLSVTAIRAISPRRTVVVGRTGRAVEVTETPAQIVAAMVCAVPEYPGRERFVERFLQMAFDLPPET